MFHPSSFSWPVSALWLEDTLHLPIAPYLPKKQGVLVTESTLPYLQCAPMSITRPTFLQKTLLAYSRSRKYATVPPPPPSVLVGYMPLWPNVLFKNDSGQTYCSRKMLLRKGNPYGSVVSENGLEISSPEGMPQQWLDVYCKVINGVSSFLYNPPVPMKSTISVENRVPGWTKKVMLMNLQTDLRPEPRQWEEVWKVFSRLKLPPGECGRTPWKKLPVGDRVHVRGGSRVCPFDGPIEDHKHTATQNCTMTHTSMYVPHQKYILYVSYVLCVCT